ncbi:MAG: hypothetical protein IMX02_00855 [Limnochordaceae bacterium]|nr:hypothetical protein [Limnochordaceae bacterium]
MWWRRAAALALAAGAVRLWMRPKARGRHDRTVERPSLPRRVMSLLGM